MLIAIPFSPDVSETFHIESPSRSIVGLKRFTNVINSKVIFRSFRDSPTSAASLRRFLMSRPERAGNSPWRILSALSIASVGARGDLRRPKVELLVECLDRLEDLGYG